MSPEIRPMVSADKPAIMHILRLTKEFKPSEVLVAEELLDSYLEWSEASGYHIAVVVDEGQAAGYICFGPTPLTEGTWDIYWAAVDPLKKGKGMGTALFEYAEKKIGACGGRLILIETSSKPEYEKTKRFHLNQGYEPIGRIEDFYEPGDDMLIFRKKLHWKVSADSCPEWDGLSP